MLAISQQIILCITICLVCFEVVELVSSSSDLWDRVTLSSESKSPKNISNGCYAAAVVQDGKEKLVFGLDVDSEV